MVTDAVISKVLLTVSPFRPSFLPPLAVHPANNRFFTPLFSTSSESPYSELLCFHIYLRCPLLFSGSGYRFSRDTDSRATSHMHVVASVSLFKMNTCKSVSKQRTLTTFRMNTYAKPQGGTPRRAHHSPVTIHQSLHLWQNPNRPACRRQEEPCLTVSTTSRTFAPTSTKKSSAAATSASSASSPSTIKPTSPARSAPRPRNSSASSPAPFSAATIASPTTSCAAAKKVGSAKRSSTPSMSPSSSAAPSPFRTSAAPSHACAKSTVLETPNVITFSIEMGHELLLIFPRAMLKQFTAPERHAMSTTSTPIDRKST